MDTGENEGALMTDDSGLIHDQNYCFSANSESVNHACEPIAQKVASHTPARVTSLHLRNGGELETPVFGQSTRVVVRHNIDDIQEKYHFDLDPALASGLVLKSMGAGDFLLEKLGPKWFDRVSLFLVSLGFLLLLCSLAPCASAFPVR